VRSPVVISYGGGTNSTALLIGLVERQEPVDLILFADTGGERPGTYAYIEVFSAWLVERGYPEIVTVKTVNRDGDVIDLETECRENGRLPSLAYGFKKCSQKFKIQPQDKFVNNWPPAKDAWALGLKVVKLIGFDADEPGRAARQEVMESDKWEWRHPLVEWNWGREECVEAIEAADLPQPGKSSCFFCPAMKPREILQIKACHPDLLERALAIERAAAPHCRGSIVGLGRDWKWEDMIKADESQLKLFKTGPSVACGCYDG
jgi:hypothetical protein